ncbi:protein LURP-one-related 7-like isoform X2 [Hibiscus syriacus]|uniref:protein LURP-one-related 7-like isoform X2 n=1 Tax=Hibiscus syriacus TaxID=106335 RepID=UPI0019207DA7|nr:protein LURP-one-related 7-like isoform X2 [Hibiscus syriacus]
MTTTSAPIFPANTPIPIDLFVSKKHPGLPRGVIEFTDYSENIVYRVNRQFPKSSSNGKAVLLDSAGNPLFSLYPHHDGSWQGFKGDEGDKDLIFKVQRIVTKLTRTELEVFLVAENQGQGELTCDFKVIGCHFQRSCTIYKGDSIVAQITASIISQKSGWRGR